MPDTCLTCGKEIVQKAGAGRLRLRCTGCRGRAIRTIGSAMLRWQRTGTVEFTVSDLEEVYRLTGWEHSPTNGARIQKLLDLMVRAALRNALGGGP